MKRRLRATSPLGRIRACVGLILIGMTLAALPGAAFGKDYVVKFIKETYKSKAADADTAGRVYHTWAVETEFGKKLLVLRGDDPVARGWLREFAKSHELFLAKVPEAESGAFELNTVVEIAVTHLHPVDSDFVEQSSKKRGRRRR